MENEKISVIIPVFNVENYLNRCVESVLRQSYKNLEVLLIDDGSTDRSGLLCDKWANKDSRILVIHKKNGGVSDARNVGLDVATGDYIAFVDSDDYISPDMMAILFSALKKNDADMSICNFFYVNDQGTPLYHDDNSFYLQDGFISGFDAITASADARTWYNYVIWDVVWNKLFKKSLFCGLRYPKGKIHEDSFVAHRLLGKSRLISCVSDICYYYVSRSGSIMSNRSSLYISQALLDRAVFCAENGLVHCAGRAYWRAAMVLPDCCHNGFILAPNRELDQTFDAFRKYFSLCKSCTVKEKTQILIVYFSPLLYRIIFRNPLWQKARKRLN